ncbi:MAG: type II toxin-antitoxin system RelE/ParE family toxin [Thermomicrobiales bacterium]
MAWKVATTDQCNDWLQELGEKEQDAILAAIEVLEAHGPGLGRPLVDTVKGSTYANMKPTRT